MAESVIVVHENPIGRTAPYCIARIHLAYSGLKGQMEQIWLNKVTEGCFEMACVPLCAYGLSFRDRVSLDSGAKYVDGLIEKSGNRVFRLLLKPGLADAVANLIRRKLETAAEALGVLREWHGTGMVAFNIPKGVDVEPLLNIPTEGRGAGNLFWEWGDLKGFSKPDSMFDGK